MKGANQVYNAGENQFFILKSIVLFCFSTSETLYTCVCVYTRCKHRCVYVSVTFQLLPFSPSGCGWRWRHPPHPHLLSQSSVGVKSENYCSRCVTVFWLFQNSVFFPLCNFFCWCLTQAAECHTCAAVWIATSRTPPCNQHLGSLICHCPLCWGPEN